MSAFLKNPKLPLNFVEIALSAAGVVAAITPLALWASWSEAIFYTVLIVGCGSFLVFIGLSKVRGYLLGEEPGTGGIGGYESVRQRVQDWDRLQEQDPKMQLRQRAKKGDAKRDFSFMLRVTFGLIVTVTLVFAGVWAVFEYIYGA